MTTTVRTILGRTTVQAIIALAMTAGFLWGFGVIQNITAEMYNVAFALVLGFFFGRQSSGS